MATKKILIDLDLKGKIDATGTVLGSNLSGTNTGDQDLSGFVSTAILDDYLLNTTDTFTGNLTVTGNSTGQQFVNQVNSNAGSSAYVTRKWTNDVGNAEIWRNSSTRTQTGGAAQSFNIYNSQDVNLWSGGTRALNLDASQNATFAGNVTMDGQLVVNTFIKLGDGGNGVFYSDTDGRTAFNNGDFYIQSSVTNYYNYATNQYIGNSSGNNIYFRANEISGDNWQITASGNISANNLSGTNTGDQDLSGFITTSAADGKYLLNTTDTLNGDLTVTGDVVLDSDNSRLRIKSGVTGTNGGIDWTFNTNGTQFAKIDLDYDLRASQGLLIDSGYPITVDFSTNYLIKKSGSTVYTIDNSGNHDFKDGSALFKKQILNNNNANVDGSNFKSSTTNKDSTLFAYEVERNGSSYGITNTGKLIASTATFGGNVSVNSGFVAEFTLNSIADADSVINFKQANVQKAKTGYDSSDSKYKIIVGDGNFGQNTWTLDSVGNSSQLGNATFGGNVTVGENSGNSIINVNSTDAYAQMKATSGSHVREWTVSPSGEFYVWMADQSIKPLSISASGASTFGGNVSANNLSGTNTGDQDLSSLMIKGSQGTIGNNPATFGTTTNWPNNPEPGSYKTTYSGFSGLVMMSNDVGGSTSSIGLELAYNGNFVMHSNTDSNSWTSHTVWTENNFANNSGNWNTAYGWGNHASASYITTSTADGKYLLNTTDTLTGNLTVTGDVSTDGIFKVDSAPDNNILEVNQSGRKMALKTSFAGDAVGSFWAFKVSNGNVNGSMTDALIVKPQEATFAGTVGASNLSGTNTGDQDLSGFITTSTADGKYLLNTTDTFAGTLTVDGNIDLNKASTYTRLNFISNQNQGLNYRMTSAIEGVSNSGFALKRTSGTAANIMTFDGSDKVSFIGDASFGGDIILNGDSEHKLYFNSTSLITGATTDTTILTGRQVDIYALDDVVIRSGSTDAIKLMSGSALALTLDSSQNATFEGNVSANNLSGTNTGDQDLSSYAVGDLGDYVLKTGSTMTGQLELSGASPQLKFTDTTATSDDFWVHVNGSNFYVLTDRDDNGSWDGAHPLQLNASNNTSYTFGNEIYTTANLPTIPSGNSIIDWTADQGATNIHANNITGYTSNVSTNISVVENATTVSINSSDGSDDTIAGATASLAGVVTNAAQTFGGDKTFDDLVGINRTPDSGYQLTVGTADISGNLYSIFAEGRIFTSGDVGALTMTVQNDVEAGGFKTVGGTSSQFLKANGSVDSNTYLTSSSTQSKYLRSDQSDTSSGNITASNFILSSDVRLKRDFLPLESKRLKPKRWTWKDSEEKDFGFIAQELEVDFPEVVVTGKDGFKKVAYNKITAINASRINELEDENQILKDEVTQLKEKMELIMKHLNI